MEALQAEGFPCYSYEVDIADREQVYQVAKRVKQEVGQVNILINNAGIVTCRTLLDLPDKAIESTYNVNILSHYWVSKRRKSQLPTEIQLEKKNYSNCFYYISFLGVFFRFHMVWCRQ